MEIATRRPALGPLSEAGYTPLHVEKEGSEIARCLDAACTGEQDAKCSRQLSYAEVGA